jgi:hypothetical protein
MEIFREKFWEYPDMCFGNIQRCVLGISRHVFWEHPDMGFGDIQAVVLEKSTE